MFNLEKKVKIQPECTDITPPTVAKFTRPNEPPAKKLPAAGNGLDTPCWYCATENREAIIKTSSHLSLMQKRYKNILGLFHVPLVLFFNFLVPH
jgi:hypothetical protein